MPTPIDNQVAHPMTTRRTNPASDEKWSKVWETMYNRLVKYREANGNCLVPQRYAKDAKLGRWVNKQRENKYKLSQHRKKLLDDIGFVWSVVSRESWIVMFERLVAYKRQHYHCLVPQRYQPDPRLGGWVREQRKNRHHLAPERRRLLDSIGFTWRVRGLHEPCDTATPPSPPQIDQLMTMPVTSPMSERSATSIPPIQGGPTMASSPLDLPSTTQDLLLKRKLCDLIKAEQEREATTNLCILELLHRKKRVSSLGATSSSWRPPTKLHLSNTSLDPSATSMATPRYTASQRSATSRAMVNELILKPRIFE